MIHGNIDGVKKTVLASLEEIYNIEQDKIEVVNQDIAKIICEVSCNLNREVSVLIDRKGKIVEVAIGDSSSVSFSIEEVEGSLCGVRLIHTHPNGNSKLSNLDLSALSKLKLDAVIAIGCLDGKMESVNIGTLALINFEIVEKEESYSVEEFFKLDFFKNVLPNEKELTPYFDEDFTERAIIVGTDTIESLAELKELAYAANVSVVDEVFQSRAKRDSSLFIGRGKAEEIASLRQIRNANIIIFDDELAGSDIRNLEDLIGVKVIDRTILILEIFARRAKSKESKIQVELAQLKYRLPRLKGLGRVLSRTGGGIGSKGPGETKLETDKRRIRERIYDLTKELTKIKNIRRTQREKRDTSGIIKVSLAGYTNAGKSTLRNLLCKKFIDKGSIQKEEVFAEDMLFATLETTTRAIRTLENKLITITDTVGFINKLPHYLIESFKSTLEEVINSDFIIHVVDVSSENFTKDILVVEEILTQLGAKDIKMILAVNKTDRISKEEYEEKIESIKPQLKIPYVSILGISSKEDINIDLLVEEVVESIRKSKKVIALVFPYENTKEATYLHRNCNVLKEEYKDEGIYYEAEMEDIDINKMKEFIVETLN